MWEIASVIACSLGQRWEYIFNNDHTGHIVRMLNVYIVCSQSRLVLPLARKHWLFVCVSVWEKLYVDAK